MCPSCQQGLGGDCIPESPKHSPAMLATQRLSGECPRDSLDAKTGRIAPAEVEVNRRFHPQRRVPMPAESTTGRLVNDRRLEFNREFTVALRGRAPGQVDQMPHFQAAGRGS